MYYGNHFHQWMPTWTQRARPGLLAEATIEQVYYQTPFWEAPIFKTYQLRGNTVFSKFIQKNNWKIIIFYPHIFQCLKKQSLHFMHLLYFMKNYLKCSIQEILYVSCLCTFTIYWMFLHVLKQIRKM